MDEDCIISVDVPPGSRFKGYEDVVVQDVVAHAAWKRRDDTGARHQGRNAVTTQIGNDAFSWFATTKSKTRLNFLELLSVGRNDCVINDAALDYMGRRKLAGSVIALLAGHETTVLAGSEAWGVHLKALGITTLEVHPDSVTIATEGVLWGGIMARGLLKDTVILT